MSLSLLSFQTIHELDNVNLTRDLLESSEDVGVGTILGGVNNHIKAVMLHPLKDQRCPLIEGP